MRVDLDGGFTVNESIPATDAAKMVLGLMKQEWLADAQATKIREQEEYINRLVKAGNYLDECLLSIAGENLPIPTLVPRSGIGPNEF